MTDANATLATLHQPRTDTARLVASNQGAQQLGSLIHRKKQKQKGGCGNRLCAELSGNLIIAESSW